MAKDTIQIPESLASIAVTQTAPVARNTLYSGVEYRNLPQKKRNSQKKSIIENRPPTSHTAARKIQIKNSKQPHLHLLETHTTSKFKPYAFYFHFIIQTTNENPVSQTYPFVLWGLKLLLLQHKFANNYTTISNWSDGGPKHFKVYSLQFELARLCQNISP